MDNRNEAEAIEEEESVVEIGAVKRRREGPPPVPKSNGDTSPTGVTVASPPAVTKPFGPDHDNIGADSVKAKHAFDLDYTDQRGYHWSGKFRCHVLTIRERAAVGLTRSKLTANTPPEMIDASTLNILEMQAHLALALDDAPEWANELGEIYDVGVLGAIYQEVASHEARFWGANVGSDSDQDAEGS